MVAPNFSAGFADFRLAMIVLRRLAGSGDGFELGNSALYCETKSSMPTSTRNGALRLIWLNCTALAAVFVVFRGTARVARTLAAWETLRTRLMQSVGELLHPYRAAVTPTSFFHSGVL